MKKLLLLLIAFITMSSVKSQTFSTDCTVPKFSYVMPYFQPVGGGFEAGMWPQEDLIGGALGMSILKPNSGIIKNNETTTTFPQVALYTAGLVRILPHVTAVGYLGVNDLDKLYTGVGIRYAMNVNATHAQAFALIIEPMYTVNGFTARVGLGIAL